MNEENKNDPLNMNMPASPSRVVIKGGRVSEDQYDNLSYYAMGLTKLEAFTMAAMQGFIANHEYSESSDETVSKCAVSLAKATLEALENDV